MLKSLVKTKLKIQNFKASAEDMITFKKKADQYTNGNVSEWIRFAASNHRPRKSQLTSAPKAK